jgi:hypothetical protein
MIIVRFDVNDEEVRNAFFDHHLPAALAAFTDDAMPRWGAFSPREMVEHLLWGFELSTGAAHVACATPEAVLRRVKAFLHDNRPTPRAFMNPMLVGGLPPPRFTNLTGAVRGLHEGLSAFVRLAREKPEERFTHPIFGTLTMEEWHRGHFKHCYHHVLQFGLIEEPSPDVSA